MTVDLTTQSYPLLDLMGTAQAPVIIDVCLPEDVAANPIRLPGARRYGHRNTLEILQETAPNHHVVVVCQKGLKLSQGVAAYLRAQGHTATALNGGIAAWVAAGHPIMSDTAEAPCYALPNHQNLAALLNAWLIARWIAPAATLLWVPQDMCGPVAQHFDARSATDPFVTAANAQLSWSPLIDFLHHAMNDTPGWVALLEALPALHTTTEAVCAHALPIIDAAWTAQRSDRGAQR